MRSITHHVDYHSRSDVIRLWWLGDMHIGARTFNEPLFRRHVQQIRNDPTALVLLGGDMIDAITRKDKRHDEETLADWCRGQTDVIGLQRDYAIDLLTPIADRVIAVFEGNHEHAIYKHAERNVYREIVGQVAYIGKRQPTDIAMGVHGFVNLRFRRHAGKTSGSGWTMTVYGHHGFGGGAYPETKIRKLLYGYECDLALLGHFHNRTIAFVETLRSVGKRVELRKRHGLVEGSYMDGYITDLNRGYPIDTYAERKGYTTHAVGASPILIDPDGRDCYLYTSGIRGTGGRLMTLDRIAEENN